MSTERQILPQERVHPAIRQTIAERNRDIVAEVEAAITAHDLVVVGMAQNPVVKKARKLLDARGLAFEYLEYGSYLSEWRRRNALKMWSGWPTFPMIFQSGVLLGGCEELERLIAAGELG